MEDDGLLCRAFQVEVNPEDDLERPATDGNEYLRRVMMEAADYPEVCTSNKDFSHLSAEQTVKFRANDPKNALSLPDTFKPSSDWQNEQIVDFSDNRSKFTQYKKSVQRREIVVDLPKLPKSVDVAGWCRFCFTECKAPVTIETLSGHQDDDTSEEGSDPPSESGSAAVDSADNGSATRVDFGKGQGHAPLLSVLVQLDQTTIEMLIEVHLRWMEATGFTEHQGRWFYALMTAIEKPLIPEMCSLLRCLVRNCAALRYKLSSPEDPLLVQLNLLITLVTKYFGQIDLADG